jgi:SAM-dependent methyltransferase
MFKRLVARISRRVRWSLGFRVAAPELESGDDFALAAFYSGRVTDCEFLLDPNHYERPRAEWILSRVSGGRLLEVGCGNGGMTRLLAEKVTTLVALDVSAPSLAAVRQLGLSNVETVQGLVEQHEATGEFDWVVLSEVLEHLRNPSDVLARCVSWLKPGGRLLITTPRGHWESNEHLQEFEMDQFAALVGGVGTESVYVSHLRDSADRRRWLVAELTVPTHPPVEDRFNDRRDIARVRRVGK